MKTKLGWFAEDFKLLTRLKQIIQEKVGQALVEQDSSPPESESFSIEEEQDTSNWFRIILPHGLESGRQLADVSTEPQTKSFYFVGFFGTRALSKCTSDKILPEVLEIDNKLALELRQNPYIICYASMIRSKVEDAFNLVIFTSEEAVALWRRSATHDTAINSISPKFYSAVRIHMGQFEWSREGDEYEVFRTTFMDYTGESPERHVEQWKETNEDRTKYCFKVTL